MANLLNHVRTLEASGLVDAQWYLDHHRDVGLLKLGAAEHYLRIGARLLRNPSPAFDTGYYLSTYPDVAASGKNPLLHYIIYGRNEGRRCVPVATGPAEVGDPIGAAGHPAMLEPSIQVSRRGGLKARDPARKTVLVCAHVAGQKMFGGERSLLDVVDGLSELAYNVIVAMPGAGHADYVQALRERAVEVLSFRYSWWRKDVPVNEPVVATFAHIIAEHAVDAVHANTIMLREPLIAARRMGIVAVAHVRELIAHDVALCEMIGEEPQAIIAQLLGGADWIVANSEATARSFAKAGATQVVPNTIDAGAFDIEPPDASHIVRVALISSNLPKKGILDFIEVAQLLEKRVPNARFVLLGPDNEQIKALKEKQAAGDLSPHIVFAGYRHNPIDAVAEADIVLNLSHFQESFGRTVLEAMAARRPVVVYDWGALPELVRDGETGFIAPFRDVETIADRVEELCRDPSRIRAMGEAARQRALAMYDKPHYIQRLRAAYDGIFSPSANPAPLPLALPARNGAGQHRLLQPLRIAYFLWHFPVPSETFVLNELRTLVEQGHDVHVYCRQSPHREFKPDFAIEWTRVETPEDLSRRLLETNRNIVHSHFTYPTVTEMVWPACELAGIAFTFIAHAQDIFRHANDEKNKIGEIGRSPLCLRVIVPSRYHRDYVESRGVPARKLFINPNGINPDLYADGWDRDRSARSKRSICAIHRFTEKKGLEHLIRAGKALAEDGIQIHLYGYGELEKQYRELVGQIGLDNVHIHGPVNSRAEMLEVFRQHDLFACPSVRALDGDMDGIPTVLMEAMASGVPVLATGISGIPDLVKDEVTGLVCEATQESITQAVRRYYAMPDSQVAAMMEDALALIRRDFSVASLSAALLRLWRQQTLDALIVSWNNLPQLREVIRRLQKFTQLPFHLVVCDNGSDQDILAYLCQVYAEYDNTTIIFNRENAYVGPGTNICMQHGDSDYAVYVCGKEGFVLDYGWEKGLVEYMETHPDVGLAGTLCHSPSYLTGAEYPKGIPLFPQFRNRAFATDNPDRRFGHVQGGFFVIRRAMHDAIGGFSDEVPHSYTDVEYSYYAESEGWKLGAPPRLLALFNKTRPGLFSRVDESVVATHPPMLKDLPLLDRIASGQVAHCNLCGWHGDAFEMRGGTAMCGECGSNPADRTLYRYLAESTLTYRRLPALGVNVGGAMETIWRHQFQGQLVSAVEFRQQLRQHGKLGFQTASLKLVHLAGLLDGSSDDKLALSEIDRVLARDGLLLFRQTADDPAQIEAVALACGLHGIEPVRFSSRVVRYDTNPLYVGRRAEVERCVS